ncbi:hypothetical protein K2173_003137 [Erythroxylum novogranatense]|uniref:BCAS3 domain-containing protein n=1 Tax=Erythroxylum novogranatense TaxID=1862640 RepID=A0AAV8TBW5_9ROSI|nr:hypothetical protein K2173_003137 [Erythroxylum novogranatense]
MLQVEIGESGILAIWVLVAFVFWVLGTIMKNSSDVKQQQHNKNSHGRVNSGFLPSSFRAISSYLRIVSSGASNVAKSAASVAQSIVDRDDDANHNQVLWAGFDKLECESGVIRRVLLLAYRSGFQVWDVEEADNVCDLVSRNDGPVSFLQMLPKPMASDRSEDRFAESRPLLVVCVDGSAIGDINLQDCSRTPCNGTSLNYNDSRSGCVVPTVVRFYSMRSQSYVHFLKFRSVVYSVRCSSQIVAISQASQIHCFDATSFERTYTIVTNPIIMSSGGVGYGPLAVGPRWLAYSGTPVLVANSGHLSPEHLRPSASFSGYSSNGSLVAHYAKESSKQLAAGIATLGDMGYKKLSRYYSELLPDSNGTIQSGNGHLQDADSIGMVVVRDIVTKLVITQFRAHKSPISALCFDPSGILLVTASVQGHNINVFRIMPTLLGSSSSGDAGFSYAHLYRLQRGFTNAVIQDISFSDDSNWIMISSSRGTSHLFAINPWGGSVIFQPSDASYTIQNGGSGAMTNVSVCYPPSLGLQMHNQQRAFVPGPPVTLSAVSRIRNGNNGWRGTVTGAAAAATGRLTTVSVATASSFHNCQGNNGLDDSSLRTKYHLLVFSPSGCMIQFLLHVSADVDLTTNFSGTNLTCESTAESDSRLAVQAIQKWNICQKKNCREQEDNLDIYGEHGIFDSNKIYPEYTGKGNGIHSEGRVAGVRTKKWDEKHHFYISEAELQMHEAHAPLWAKAEIYFHSMIMGHSQLDEEVKCGEIEIERIPTRMIEARSKDLVPVINNLHKSRIQHLRVPAMDSNINGHVSYHKSGVSENSRFSHRSSFGSLDLKTDSRRGGAGIQNGYEDTGSNGPHASIETVGSVNNNNSPEENTQLEFVNNREALRAEGHLKFVNNNNEGLKMENHFEHEGDEFD